jgi:hypothetical protein
MPHRYREPVENQLPPQPPSVGRQSLPIALSDRSAPANPARREHRSFYGHGSALQIRVSDVDDVSQVTDVPVGGVLCTRSALAMDFNPFDG